MKIKSVLKKLLDLSFEEGWYRFAMVANRDPDELDATHVIKNQFEPLELLTGVYLDEFQNNGIIKSYEGINGDVMEPSFLRKLLNITNGNAFVIGDDAKITLPNGKVVYVQDKSNTGYKQF